MRDCEVSIDGVAWQIRFVPRREMAKNKWGLCVYATNTIYVRNDLSYENIVDTLIHEITHAQRPHEAEFFVNRTSSEMAKILRISGLIGN
jgi:hypothetical protein